MAGSNFNWSQKLFKKYRTSLFLLRAMVRPTSRKKVLLNTGNTIPALGFGTYGGKNPEEEQLQDVEDAIKAGYYHLDCAYAYGTEKRVGEILRRCFEAGYVERNDMFITSKLWNAFHDDKDVLRGCQETLTNLQLDYLDLYLIHWPISIKSGYNFLYCDDEAKLGYSPKRIAKCWKVMESLVDRGLVKAIGVSNFSITKIERLLQTADIVPAVNQVECHPYFQQPKLVRYCNSKGIVVEAYASLGRPSHPDKSMPIVLEDPVIAKIAAKHSATASQVMLAYGMARGQVLLLKTRSKNRMMENLEAQSLVLDSTDMTELEALDRNLRYATGRSMLRAEESTDILWDPEDDLFTF